MDVPTLDVSLDLPPSERWQGLVAYREQAAELMAQYVREIGDPIELAPLLEAYAQDHLAPEYREELVSVAGILGRSKRSSRTKDGWRQSSVAATPSVRFEPGAPATVSLNQPWKRQVSPATPDESADAWGMASRSIWRVADPLELAVRT